MMEERREEASLAQRLELLLRETTPTAGQSFFETLARALPNVLGMRHGMVGEVAGDTADRIDVIAHWDGSRLLDPYRYILSGTPCEGVVGQEVCQYPDGVTERFPRDQLLVDMGIQAYVGLPVIGSHGATVGILVALDERPIAPIRQIESLLGLLAARAGAEIERLHAERALEQSDRRYRQLIETANEGVWVIDERGNTTLVNARMAHMLGYEPSEMLGKTVYDFMDPELVDVASSNMARRASGIAERHEFKLRARDGSAVWTLMSTNPLFDKSGTFTGALAVVTDLTEHRSLEQRLERGQKLESLGLLAGGVAHDFNNLLAAILGNVDLAITRLPAGSGTEPLLQDARAAAHRASELTSQMLQYAGRGSLTAEPLDVNELLTEMVKLLESVISKKVRMHLDLTSEATTMVGDPVQLRQVIMNLITNANDAIGGEDGDVMVRSRVEELSRERLDDTVLGSQLPERQYVAIEVGDTGCGFDESVRDRLFDPFFTTKFTGRGLGLAATLGILKQHRGTIEVTSQPGHGSTFTILLPTTEATPRPTSEAPSPTSSTSALEGRTVLVADDEDVVRKLARRVLEGVGMAVTEAEDGEQARELYQHSPQGFDVVMLDLTMPRLGGKELREEIRRSRPGQRFLLTSGYTDADLPADDRTGFIAKPWSVSQLLSALEDLVGGDRQAGQPG